MWRWVSRGNTKDDGEGVVGRNMTEEERLVARGKLEKEWEAAWRRSMKRELVDQGKCMREQLRGDVQKRLKALGEFDREHPEGLR
jgi:hypothetical protein